MKVFKAVLQVNASTQGIAKKCASWYVAVVHWCRVPLIAVVGQLGGVLTAC